MQIKITIVNHLKNLLQKAPRGELAKNTLLSLFWQLLRISFLSGWVILMARLLNAEGYGLFSGVASLATTMGSVTGLGIGFLMYQNTSRNRDQFSELWKKTLVTTIFSGSFFTVAYLIVCIIIFPKISTFTLLAIGLSELIFYPLVTASSFAFASHSKMGWSAALASLVAGLRLVALICFSYTSGAKDINEYAWYHSLATILSSAITIGFVYRYLSPNNAKFTINKKEITEGLSFCTAWFTTNSLVALDKTLVLQFGSAEIAGIYSSAYRLSNIFMLPIDALISSALPKLFVLGESNTKSPLIKYLFITLIVYGAIAALILLSIPHILIYILGDSFSGTADIIKWFALLIPCYGIRSLSSYILTSSNAVKLKIIIESGGLFLMLILAYILIPSYGLIGAAITLVSTELALAIINIVAILWKNTTK